MDKEKCLEKGGKWKEKENVCVIKKPKKKVVSEEWQLGYPLIFVIIFGLVFIAILLGPLVPAWLVLVLAIMGLFWLKYKHRLKPFKLIHLIIIPFILLAYTLLFVFLGVLAITQVSWLTLIGVGLVADIISFVMGLVEFVPFVSLITAIIVYFAVSTLIGGVWGVIFASIASIIALIPGPIALTTISFIVIRIMIEIIF